MNALEVKNICKGYKGTKGYKDFKLDNVSLSLPQGCVMGLIGENGAGKSTLIKLITGIANADSGTIAVLGTDNRSKAFTLTKQDIGVVLDYPCFPQTFTAKDINKIMSRTYKNWREDLYFDYLAKFNIDANKKFKDYSKGMKMKLPFAVALAHDAKLLILDEATSGLDPIARDEMLDIINDFTRDETHSALISSHILSDLEKVCDYIAYISNGRLILCEEKDRMLDSLVVVKCGVDELSRLDRSRVVGVRKSEFGAAALVYRDIVPKGMYAEKAAIEDIMLYMTKGEIV